MIAIDTNVVVRFIVDDDAVQSPRAKALIESNPVTVSLTVLLETAWVLESTYGFSDRQTASAIQAFASLASVTVQNGLALRQALEWVKSGCEFADALHLAQLDDGDKFATFDRKLNRFAAKSGKDIQAP